MAKIDEALFFIANAYENPKRAYDDRGLKTERVYPSLILAHNSLLSDFLRVREFQKVMTVTSFIYVFTYHTHKVEIIFTELTQISLKIFYGEMSHCLITARE